MGETRTAEVATELPAFIGLVAHPLRWRLLQELARSDRAVFELTALVGEPQNLVSYHLRKLRDGGLVSARRSSADGRDVYYAVDLATCGDQLRAAGAALHPGLALAPAPPVTLHPTRGRTPRVLFLCTGNSARSQMAEALLVHRSNGAVAAVSAGSHPKPLHPLAVRVMQRRGLDISGNQSKHLDRFVGQRLDVVVSLCDRVREVCPEFPSHPRLAHWSIADPAAGATRPTIAAFEATARELETRIAFLLAQLSTPPKGRPRHVHR